VLTRSAAPRSTQNSLPSRSASTAQPVPSWGCAGRRTYAPPDEQPVRLRRAPLLRLQGKVHLILHGNLLNNSGWFRKPIGYRGHLFAGPDNAMSLPYSRQFDTSSCHAGSGSAGVRRCPSVKKLDCSNRRHLRHEGTQPRGRLTWTGGSAPVRSAGHRLDRRHDRGPAGRTQLRRH